MRPSLSPKPLDFRQHLVGQYQWHAILPEVLSFGFKYLTTVAQKIPLARNMHPQVSLPCLGEDGSDQRQERFSGLSNVTAPFFRRDKLRDLYIPTVTEP